MSEQYLIALAPGRKPSRIGLLFTHKNAHFGVVSVEGRSRPTPILNVDWIGFYDTLLRRMNRYSYYSGSFSSRREKLSGTMYT